MITGGFLEHTTAVVTSRFSRHKQLMHLLSGQEHTIAFHVSDLEATGSSLGIELLPCFQTGQKMTNTETIANKSSSKRRKIIAFDGIKKSIQSEKQK